MRKLCFILVLSLAALSLTAFSVSAEPDYTAAQENKTLFETIGIALPDKDYSDTVTRIEYIKMLMQLVNGTSREVGSAPFKDISANDDGADAVAFAYQAGYIAAADSFRPYDEITYTEAYTAAAAVMGRTNEAERNGGYPAGYNQIAARYGLTDGLQNTADGVLSYADALVLLDNIAENDAVVVDKISAGDIVYKRDGNFYEVYFDMSEIRGVITADENTSLFDADDPAADSCIEINDEKYYYDGEYKLGEYVKGYARELDDEQYIVYIKPYRNTVNTVELERITAVSSNKISYETKDGRTKDVTVNASDYAVIYNGKAADGLLLPKLADMENGYVEFIDNNSDGKSEIVNIREHRTFVVKSASQRDKVIIDKNGEGSVNLYGSDKKITVYSDGQLQDFAAIASGQLLHIYASLDGLLYEIRICTDSISGAVTAVDNSEKTIIINDEEYDYSDYFARYYADKLILGQSRDFYIAEDGRIEACELDASSGMMYGYIVKARKVDDENGESSQLKIFNEKGELITYNLAENVKVDDISYTENETVLGLFLADGVVNRQLIRFKTNKDGEISVIDTCDATGRLSDDAKETNNLTKFTFPSTVANSLWYIESNDSFHPYFRIADTTKLFFVADGEGIADEKRCVLKTTKYFKDNRSQKSALLNVYNVTELGVAGAMVVIDANAVNPQTDSTSPLAIVYSVKYTMTDDNVLTYKVSVFENGAFNIYYVAEDSLERFAPDGKPSVAKGDCIRYVLNNDNEITAVSCEYDMSEQRLMKPLPDNSTSTHTSKGVVYSGMVYDIDASDITIVPEGVPGISFDPTDPNARFSMTTKSCKFYAVEKDCERIYETTADDIRTYKLLGNGCNRVLIIVSDGAAQYVIIYK